MKNKSKVARVLASDLKMEDRQTARMHNKEFRDVLAVSKPAPRKVKKWKKKGAPRIDVQPPIMPKVAPPEKAVANYPVNYFTFRQEETENGPVHRLIADSGCSRVMQIHTGFNWADTVLNGIPPPGDCRYPDPFCLVKTVTTVVSQTQSLTSIATSTSSSSSSYDYGQVGFIKGSPVYTWTNNTFSAAAISTAAAINWTGTNTAHWANSALNSSDFYARPNGVVLTIRPKLVGPLHSIRVFAVPIPPVSIATLSTASPAGWQVVISQGLTPTEVSWGGREWELTPEDKGIRLACLPGDSRAMDYLNGNVERVSVYSAGHNAWFGWRWWVYGMSQADRLEVTCNYTEELIPVSYNVGTLYAYPATDKRSDSRYRDEAVNQLASANNDGLTGYSIVDSIIDYTKRGVSFVQKWGKRLAPLLGAFAGNALPPLLVVSREEKLREERKEDEVVLVEKQSVKSSSISSSGAMAPFRR